jgi:hypothetical protein
MCDVRRESIISATGRTAPGLAPGARHESGRWGNPIGNRPEPERMLYAWLGALVLQFICFFASCDDFFVGQDGNRLPTCGRLVIGLPLAVRKDPRAGVLVCGLPLLWGGDWQSLLFECLHRASEGRAQRAPSIGRRLTIFPTSKPPAGRGSIRERNLARFCGAKLFIKAIFWSLVLSITCGEFLRRPPIASARHEGLGLMSNNLAESGPRLTVFTG